MTPETPPPAPPRRRRRFTLSLRALMVLVLIVGGGVGWKVARASKQRKAIAALGQLGASITFDYQVLDEDSFPGGEPWAPAWLRNYAGDEYFQEITGVDFQYCRQTVKDADLAPLLGLDRLETVGLGRRLAFNLFRGNDDGPDDGVGDAGLDFLRRSPRLRKLDLANTNVTDAGLARLARMGNLEELDLEGTKVTVAGLAHLKTLKGLRQLKLNVPSSTDEGLALVAGHGRLQSLGIMGPSPIPITEVGWAQVAGLTDLHKLEIKFAPVSDGALALLKKLPKLRTLMVIESASDSDEATITDAGLAHIGEMAGLEELQLWLHHHAWPGFFRRRTATPITDAGFAPIGKLTHLRDLNLICNVVTDDGLSRLKGLTGLRKLYLNGGQITDAGLVHLEAMTQLDTLTLCGTEISDAGLAPLRKLTKLEFLALMNTRVSKAGFAALNAALPALLNGSF
jgi:hypothetical protein